jgi:hypothetical protein
LHWLSLKPELEGLIVPSKFYGIAAAGEPIIAITAADGEIAKLVRNHHCGRVIEPGDGEKLAAISSRVLEKPRTTRNDGPERPRHAGCAIHPARRVWAMVFRA